MKVLLSFSFVSLQLAFTFANNCNPAYYQCGGYDWTGLTCCEDGYECQYINKWYSQCVISSTDEIKTLVESVEENTEPVEEMKTINIWAVGDSTVCSFKEIDIELGKNYYYQRYGYGTQLEKYFSDNVIVHNLAYSGESSKSFTTISNYQTLIENMKAGDYLTIGFGHNDQKREERRYTNPNGDYKTPGSFANSLYKNYIEIAMERGVNIILATPIVRRPKNGKWSNETLHITSSKEGYEGGDYAQAIRDLGKELNIPVIDMTKKTKELYDSIGIENTIELHAWVSNDMSSVDNTHTNIFGGSYNAYLFTRGIKELEIPELSDYVLDAEPPTKDCLFVNPDYKY